MREVSSKIAAGGRNHLDAPCPKCGGRLVSCEAGNVPGAVACAACRWQGEWVRTDNPWDMESGGAIAFFIPHRGRPWGAREGQVRLRVDLEEKGRWTMAARRNGLSLSEWLRKLANEAVDR